MEFFERQPLMLFIATGVVGLIIGSFLNVVASRVPIMLGRIWRKEYADIKNQKLLSIDASLMNFIVTAVPHI